MSDGKAFNIDLGRLKSREKDRSPQAIEKAERVLGFDPQYSNKQALVRNYRWYLEHLAEFEGRSGVSHRVPWKQGILKVAKAFF